MNKNELILAITNEMKEREYKVSQEMTRAFLEELEATIDAVLEEGNEVKALGYKFEMVERAESKWEINGKSGITPARLVPKASALGSKKTQLSKEV